METCIFCKIVKGEIPSHKIYEDDNFLAFLDINPIAKGHTVIIPKTHAELVLDLDDEKSEQLIPTTKKVIQTLKDKLNPSGFNVGWNDGKFAGQAIPHLHLHIIPRYDGDGGGNIHSIIKNPGEMSVDEVAGLF